jgi:hypothetical protein
MTTRPGFVRRVLEWYWRSERLRELQAAGAPAKNAGALAQVEAYRTLAGRTLGGLEPVPAQSRAATARPLLRAGIEQVLRLQPTPCPSIEALFDDSTWQRALEVSVPEAERVAVRAWLIDDRSNDEHGAAQRALLLLETLQGMSDEAASAIAHVRLWRLGMLGATLGALGALLALVLWLMAPPEGQDLAVNKPWRASSAYVGYTVEGRKPERPSDVAFFCTNEDEGAWWQIDLLTPQLIDRVTLVNRSDCCAERATPLTIEVSLDGQNWREVIRRDETFRTWRARFKPSQARYVRLRALRRTFLHMKDVRIMAPSPQK